MNKQAKNITRWSSALLTTTEMGQADRLTIEGGIEGSTLMDHAGGAVARVACDRFPSARSVLIACGPGNNGGDGYVAAARLAGGGRMVTVAALGDPNKLTGEAAGARALWSGPIVTVGDVDVADHDLVIDALFGAGLARAVEGKGAAFIAAVNVAGVPVLAVDVPSGIDGTTGAELGEAVKADVTVTFFKKKPGHCLYPGRLNCGDVAVEQIGIEDAVLDTVQPSAFENKPDLWCHALVADAPTDHKYTRGHVAVFSGGPSATGAARLAAAAAARTGAGLVSVVARPSAVLVNASHLTAIMVKRLEPEDDVAERLNDLRCRAAVIGPGFGTGAEEAVILDLALDWAENGDGRLVVDADALTLCANYPANHFQKLGENCVLTPHDGEFARLFADLVELSRVDRARAAAARTGSVVVLKGADTIVAEPGGLAAINTNAPPALATAGSGDVLAGAIAALVGRGMPLFEAAACACWLHGEAGHIAGLALTADDLPEAIGEARVRLAEDLRHAADRSSDEPASHDWHSVDRSRPFF